jgi:Ni,Fe-hydrogenase III component G
VFHRKGLSTRLLLPGTWRKGWWPLRRAGVTRLYLSQSSDAIAAWS